MGIHDRYTCEYLIGTLVITWSIQRRVSSVIYMSAWLIYMWVLDWHKWVLDCYNGIVQLDRDVNTWSIYMWVLDRYNCEHLIDTHVSTWPIQRGITSRECYSSLKRKYSLHDYKKKRYLPDCWNYVLHSIQYYWIHGFASDVFSCTWIQKFFISLKRGIYMWWMDSERISGWMIHMDTWIDWWGIIILMSEW